MSPSRQSGLTLLEFLVGLVLFGMIMLLLGQGNRIVLDAWSRTGQSATLEHQRWAASRLLQRQIMAAVAYRPGKGRPARAVAFIGLPDRVTLVTTSPLGHAGRLGIWYVRYGLEPDPEGMGDNLVVWQWSAQDTELWTRGRLPLEPVVLLRGVEGLSIDYQKNDLLRRTTEYFSDWPDAPIGKLPSAIRMIFTWRGQEQEWIFPLAVGAS